MILASRNKENVSHKMSAMRRIRRRSRVHSSFFSYHATREAARRTHYSSSTTHGRSYDLAVDDAGMGDADTTHFRPSQSKSGSFPKHLKRPTFRGVAPDAISTVDPDLRGVPLQFIHQKIQAAGERLFASASQTAVRPSMGRLPRELQVIVNDVSVDMPTHVFAVYSHPSALQKHHVATHPVHALILAANCANLPPIPVSKPTTPDYPGSSVTLPVIPLCIPSPDTFPILLDYLYTRRGEHLLQTLLPLPPHDDSASLQQLARQLARSLTVPGLLSHVYRTQGLWSNVAALGVSDEQLWRAMDVAWEVLRGALAARSGEV